ncbi:MAG: hypothetical protein IJV07_05125 [Alphaproteobacteria bacterium]|nr:hypothetical protein [Alphaproteobacteria bacterium]
MKNIFLKQTSIALFGVALMIGGSNAFAQDASSSKGVADLAGMSSKFTDPKELVKQSSLIDDKNYDTIEDLLEAVAEGPAAFAVSDDVKDAKKNINKEIDKLKDGSLAKVSELTKEWNEAKDQFGDLKGGVQGQIDGIKGMSEKAKNSLTQEMQNAKGEFDNYTKGFKGNLSILDSESLKAVEDDIGQDVKQKVKDFATGKELTRLVNEEVVTDLNDQLDKTSSEGTGVPTIDWGNLTAGIYNLESVYGSYHQNEGVRDMDTRACAAMGVGGLGKGQATGDYCCDLWVNTLFGSEGSNTSNNGLKTNIVAESGSGSGAGSSREAAKQYCCKLSKGMCEPVSAQKSECLKNNLKNGGSAEGAWKACEIECGKKNYGELVHNKDGKYNESQIDDLMKECYEEESKWSPSPTVLTASEMAPVVPSVLKKYVDQ